MIYCCSHWIEVKKTGTISFICLHTVYEKEKLTSKTLPLFLELALVLSVQRPPITNFAPPVKTSAHTCNENAAKAFSAFFMPVISLCASIRHDPSVASNWHQSPRPPDLTAHYTLKQRWHSSIKHARARTRRVHWAPSWSTAGGVMVN